jgi:hypothetical protein
MKFNWGTKIGIVYTVFVLFILGMVYLAFGEKFDLVTEDYYAQEIAFQEKIDSKNRLNNLDKELNIKLESGELIIYFPHGVNTQIQGKVNCFRPSDENKDFEVKVNTTAAKQSIPLEQFVKGKYTLKIDWKAEDEHYYTEQIIIIP